MQKLLFEPLTNPPPKLYTHELLTRPPIHSSAQPSLGRTCKGTRFTEPMREREPYKTLFAPQLV